jgi:hypothetical protein
MQLVSFTNSAGVMFYADALSLTMIVPAGKDAAGVDQSSLIFGANSVTVPGTPADVLAEIQGELSTLGVDLLPAPPLDDDESTDDAPTPRRRRRATAEKALG